MPRVTILKGDGTTSTNSGGCFGFAGRHGSVRGRFGARDDVTAEEFIYHLGENKHSQDFDDRKHFSFLQYLLNRSPWSKYVLGSEGISDGHVLDSATVRIKTDIDGHAVIGTASMFRLAVRHKSLVELWNQMVDAGSDENIAFILSYIGSRRAGVSYSQELSQNASPAHWLARYLEVSGTLGWGDDEPCDFSSISPTDIYNLIKNEWTYSTIDSTRPEEKNYKYQFSYRQQILSSFNSGSLGIDFSRYIRDRFLNESMSDIVPNCLVSTSAMGSSNNTHLTDQGRTRRASALYHPTFLIGIACQLTYEFKLMGKFLHLDNTETGAINVR